MLLRSAVILSNERLSQTLMLLKAKVLDRSKLKAAPFNFFMVWIPGVDEIPLSVAFLEDGCIHFLYKVRGSGTAALASMRPGSVIGLKGPLGRGLELRNGERVLAVSGGVGIAPIPYLIKKAVNSGARVDVIWGIRSIGDLFPLIDVFGLRSWDGALIVATEDCSYGLCGTALDALSNIDVRKYDLMVAVGPMEMLRLFCERFGESGDAYVALETLVKCGVGVCGSCYVRRSTKLLCVEGPLIKCCEARAHLESASA